MNFLVKRILKTFLTILLTSLVLLALIFGGVKIWQWINESDFVGDDVDVVEPEPTPDDEQPDTPPTPDKDDDKGALRWLYLLGILQDDEDDQPDTPTPDGKGGPIGEEKGGPTDIVSVKVIEAEIPEPILDADDFISKTGVINADQAVSVYPETTAILQNLKVQEGQKVEAGTLLATVGNSLQLEVTKVNYNSAIKSLQLAEESLRLTQINSNITEATFSNQLQTARLNLRQAIQQLENSQLVRFQQDVVEELTDKVQAATTETTETTDNTDENEDKDEEPTDAEKYQKLLELHQQNLQNSQGRGQDLQSHYQIMNAQNQLNLLLKQLEGQKVQAELQQINALSQINQIRQQLETAKVNLDATKIISPISGVITQINADPGARVTPNESFLTITNFNSIIVQVSLTPEELFLLKPNATATINLFDQEIPAEIIFTSPVANAVTRTITVKVAPKNEANLPLIPNTFAQVTFTNPKPETVGFVYPVGLIKFKDRKAFVPVVSNNIVKYQPVKIGSINNGMATITSGIQNGDLIIIHPRLLPERLPVKVTK